MKNIILYIILPVLLLSCKKDEISNVLSASPGIYFIYDLVRPVNIDSITYSFVGKSEERQADTLWLPVRISGVPVDHDRSVNLIVAQEGTTAVQDKHYKLMEYTMPKDSFATRLGIILLRDMSLVDTAVTLTLRLQSSEDFTASMKDTLMADGRFYSRNQVKIIFTDRLLKPDNWETSLISFFGAYSNEKFRFITSTLGISAFPTSGPNAFNFPRMQFYQNTVRNALAEYTSANGPLIDENGNIVVIP